MYPLYGVPSLICLYTEAEENPCDFISFFDVNFNSMSSKIDLAIIYPLKYGLDSGGLLDCSNFAKLIFCPRYSGSENTFLRPLFASLIFLATSGLFATLFSPC